MGVLASRLRVGEGIRQGMSPNSLNIMDATFMTLLSNAWSLLYKDNPEYLHNDPAGLARYQHWMPDVNLRRYARGSWPPWAQPWHKVPDLILICHCGESQHWVTCRVRLLEWEIHLYDSMMYQMDDPSDPIMWNWRVKQLTPLKRLLPRLLQCTKWFERMNMEPNFVPLKIVRMPISEQFAQTDSHNCGAYACMYVESMILSRFVHPTSDAIVAQYRQHMALSIFASGEDAV